MFLVTPFITTNTGNYESLYAKYRTENILMLSKNTQISELKTHRNFKDVLHDMRQKSYSKLPAEIGIERHDLLKSSAIYYFAILLGDLQLVFNLCMSKLKSSTAQGSQIKPHSELSCIDNFTNILAQAFKKINICNIEKIN